MTAAVRDYKKKSILVTGASSGIGKATAKLLAGNGARLIVAARSFDKLQSLAQEIDAFPVACDVTSLDSVEKMVEAAIQHNGRIDALFASAGIYRSGDVARRFARRLV
jgi:NADP-dependent 3-hydroxy acid dehydrogenase YdfG